MRVLIVEDEPYPAEAVRDGLRKRLGEPWRIATVAGAGHRIDTAPGT
jgi:DNA-binding response OmpR family regulator